MTTYQKNNFTAALIITLIAAYSIPMVNAYSIYPTSSATPNQNFNFTNGFTELSVPFENFIRSMENNTITINPMVVMPPSLGTNAQNYIGQFFDDWIYSVTGFRVSIFFNILFSTVGTIINGVVSAIDQVMRLSVPYRP